MYRSIHTQLLSHYSPRECPACLWQYDRWERSKPLSGLEVLDATPLYFNTLAKYLPLLAGGAKLTVGLSDEVGHDTQMFPLLQRLGISVCFAHERILPKRFDVILDCAAMFADRESRVGYVELTRSGVERYRNKKEGAVFVADSGRIKKIETCLGTGESYFRAMESLGYHSWQGCRMVIFGSGKVGSGLITYAYRRGAEVTVVTDVDTVQEKIGHYIHRLIDRSDWEKVLDALSRADAVVTATGIPGALGDLPVGWWKHTKAILANMGVTDEYGEAVPEGRVLNRKHTLNFILEEPTRLRYIDATFALHNAGISYLLQHPGLTKGLIIPPVDMEQEILSITRDRGYIGRELDWFGI